MLGPSSTQTHAGHTCAVSWWQAHNSCKLLSIALTEGVIRRSAKPRPSHGINVPWYKRPTVHGLNVVYLSGRYSSLSSPRATSFLLHLHDEVVWAGLALSEHVPVTRLAGAWPVVTARKRSRCAPSSRKDGRLPGISKSGSVLPLTTQTRVTGG